jgi:hypothetical protein
VTWKDYETDLDKRLEDLRRRVHRGTYPAQPSKRAYVPKADGRQRPRGIAALEDKIVQQTVGTDLHRSTKRTFWDSRTGSGRGEASTPCAACAMDRDYEDGFEGMQRWIGFGIISPTTFIQIWPLPVLTTSLRSYPSRARHANSRAAEIE